MKILVATLLVLLGLVGGCSSSDEQSAPTPATTATPGTGPSQDPDQDPGQDPGEGTDPDVSASDTCGEVRAGIEAFNLGDYDETVARFEAAVPLAEAADDGTSTAGDLLEAVRYYADLAPEDYPQAAQTSEDFERYKQITLGQCESTGGSTATQDPGIEA